MYWSASTMIWFSISESFIAAFISMILVMTADPATATAASFVAGFRIDSACRMASPTASMSLMFFSTTAFTGNCRMT